MSTLQLIFARLFAMGFALWLFVAIDPEGIALPLAFVAFMLWQAGALIVDTARGAVRGTASAIREGLKDD